MKMLLEQEIMIDKTKSFPLSSLPVNEGEVIKVVILQKNKLLDQSIQERLNKWQALFKLTQALPEIQDLTETDIQIEIDACRRGL